jgi:predicted outer membrane repeat protein
MDWTTRRFLPGIAYGLLIIVLLALAGPVAAVPVLTIDNSSANAIASNLSNVDDGGTLILNPGTYFENGLTISANITIRANTSYSGTASNTIIDAGSLGRIFYNNNKKSLTIDNLTLQNGNAAGNAGGAIRTDAGSVTITSSTIRDCGAVDGGAIASSFGAASGATITIISSTITDCSASQYGGAVFGGWGGDVITITSSTISDCTASAGGAVYFGSGTHIITGSTFTNCSATSGGAIYTSGTMTITSSTFSSCPATNGGAIFNSGTMTITSSTFSSCSASSGGAIYHNSGVSTVHYSRIYNCNTGTAVVHNAGTFSATNTWWGTNANPAGYTSGSVTSTPWLRLGATASPSSIASSQTSLIRANLTFDSAGTNTIASGHIPNDTVVMFAIVSGPGSLSAAGNATTFGAAEITFTPAGAGTTNISATVDDQTVYTRVTVSLTPPAATFTGTPTAGTAPLAVTFTETSTNSPTTWNWSFGDGTWFNTTNVAAKDPVHTYPTAGTYTVSLTASNADGPDTLTRAGYITASAVPVTTVTTTTTTTAVPVNGGDDGFPASFTPKTYRVNVGGNSAVSFVDVTGTGIRGLIVTGTVQNGPGSGIPAAPGTVYQYIELVPARFTSISSATITFTVPVAWLEEHHLTPQDIVLSHYVNGAWVALPTTVGSTSNGIVTFSADSPGFSLFAIGGQQGTGSTVPPERVKSFNELTGAQAPSPALAGVTQHPVVQQTTTVPVPAGATEPVFPLPVIAIAGLVILAAGGFMARRWWIHRQNPALCKEYD